MIHGLAVGDQQKTFFFKSKYICSMLKMKMWEQVPPVLPHFIISVWTISRHCFQVQWMLEAMYHNVTHPVAWFTKYLHFTWGLVIIFYCMTVHINQWTNTFTSVSNFNLLTLFVAFSQLIQFPVSKCTLLHYPYRYLLKHTVCYKQQHCMTTKSKHFLFIIMLSYKLS